MTAHDHTQAAEGYLRSGDLQRAQVHATLAQALAAQEQAEAMTWAVRLWEGSSRWGRAAMMIYWLSAGLRENSLRRWEER